MPCEDMAPNYCDIGIARISTDSSHTLAISLAVLRQVIRVSCLFTQQRSYQICHFSDHKSSVISRPLFFTGVGVVRGQHLAQFVP